MFLTHRPTHLLKSNFKPHMLTEESHLVTYILMRIYKIIIYIVICYHSDHLMWHIHVFDVKL